MRICLKILTLAFFPVLIKAQQHTTDSLKQVLKTAATDSARFSICTDLYKFYREDNRDSAVYYANQCLLIAQKNAYELGEAQAFIYKAYAFLQLRKFPEAYQSLRQAFKIAEDPKNESTTWIINKQLTARKNRLNILAMAYLCNSLLDERTGDTIKPLIDLNKAANLISETGNIELDADINMVIGNMYSQSGKFDSALVFEKKAEALFKKSATLIYSDICYYALSNIYAALQNNELALQYFHKGIESALQQGSSAGINYGYLLLSNYFLSKKQKDSSLYYAYKSLSILKSTRSQYLGDSYEALYKAYQLINNIDSAHRYLQLTMEAKDSMYNATIQNLSTFQRRSFKEQLQFQQLQEEKTLYQSRIKIFAAFGALAVFLVIAFILYSNNRKQKKVNSLLASQKEKVETTLTELKSTQAQLIQQEKMASLGELTAGIAHEIQNPLNFVNNFSEVNKELLAEMNEEIEKENYDEVKAIAKDVTDNEQKIIHHGKRADSIVKGMLQHSRASTGKKESTDINVLTDEYLRLSYHGMRAKDKTFNATLQTDFDTTIEKINIIPQDIGRVLLNLFNNAFYAVTQKKNLKGLNSYEPTVSVFTKKVDGKIEIHVKDNGIGILQKVVDKIFQPFFTTKPTGQGTGLGLSLSYDIIKAHGGDIRVETKEGEGSEFIVVLPFS